MIAQRKAHARNQAYDSEIVKLDMVIKGKKGSMDTMVDLAKIYREMGEREKALDHMKSIEGLLVEIGAHTLELETLKNGNKDSLVVEEYLKRGRVGMGIETPVTKKNKTSIQGNTKSSEMDGSSSEYST